MPLNSDDLNRRIHQFVERTEDEVQRLIGYVNDEVVPDVRREGSAALHRAAESLQAMARKLDNRR